jgi:hypothetical protein
MIVEISQSLGFTYLSCIVLVWLLARSYCFIQVTYIVTENKMVLFCKSGSASLMFCHR